VLFWLGVHFPTVLCFPKIRGAQLEKGIEDGTDNSAPGRPDKEVG